MDVDDDNDYNSNNNGVGQDDESSMGDLSDDGIHSDGKEEVIPHGVP